MNYLMYNKNEFANYIANVHNEENQKLHERVKKTRFEVWVKKNIA